MKYLKDEDVVTAIEERWTGCPNEYLIDILLPIKQLPPAKVIPIEWIQKQMIEYPGMESSMWGKLIRLWEASDI